MSNRVRATEDGLERIRASVGASTFHGITVAGHCMGIVARTWRLPSQPAGYGTAFDGAQAVQRAGRMRSSASPPVGSVVWWAHRSSNNRPGHVATVNRPGFCLGNVGSTIQEAALSRFGNLRYLGWCWPADVPGWGPVATPPTTPPNPPEEDNDMPLTDQDVQRIARAVWDRRFREYVDENNNGVRDERTVGDVLMATHGAAVRTERSVGNVARAVWERVLRTVKGEQATGTILAEARDAAERADRQTRT